MAGLNARGLQSKLLIIITHLVSGAIIIIIILKVWCSLISVATTLSLLATYTALHSSYHIGEPSIIPKLLLPCVYDTMIMQFYY